MKIAVISDGAWGTANAIVLLANGHRVLLWGISPSRMETMRQTRRNDRLLKGNFLLPSDLELTNSMEDALKDVDYIVLASPAQFARTCLKKIKNSGYKGQSIINVAKGIEVGSLKRMSEVCQDILGKVPYAVLSGPSHAEEVVGEMPTAVVVASSCLKIAESIQHLYMRTSFRVYTSKDVIGVELGGSMKNVFAIAAGICDGMRLGDNAKAALITRGITEMARLGAALGGSPETFFGLSGVGDMIVTCTSSHSRNRYVGEQLGKGIPLEKIMTDMGRVVAEGIPTTKSVYSLAKTWNIDTPIIREIYAGLYQGKDLRQGVKDLMGRKAKQES